MKARNYIRLKNVLDYIFAGALFLLLWPLFLLISIWIKTDSTGSIFFTQKRIGKDNIPFEIYKFRTMRTDAPKDMPTHLLNNADSFITRSGSFLRKTSLDELPQLINILKGDMSFIGPRPALWNQFDLIRGRDALGVQQLKPGITGWAQINGRDEVSISEKIELDGYYLEHISLSLDIKILFLTVLSVMIRKGIREGGIEELETNLKTVGEPGEAIQKEERCV